MHNLSKGAGVGCRAYARHVCCFLQMVVFVGLSGRLCAQHSATPVLLVNGFQAFCPDTESGTFGQLPEFLEQDSAGSSGFFVDFFDVCSDPDATIETLAGLLTDKIQSYSGPVDVIAHSMGGLVVRAYLQGRTGGPYLTPPTNTKIRKLVLLGTPNFGVSNNFSLLSLLLPWTPPQVSEMQFGSQFLWNESTWNQRYDDLRGVDALAIVGTAGVFPDGVPWDGVVDVASASLDFYDSSGSRTRAVPYCHAGVAIPATCPFGSELIADVDSRSHLSYEIIRSFLDGNDGWESITPAASSVSSTGGLDFVLSDSNGNAYFANQLTAVSVAGTGLSNPVPPVWVSNGLTGGTNFTISLNLVGQEYNLSGVSIPQGGFLALPAKFPPEMTFVTSSAAPPPGALSVAPGSLISIYGIGLAAETAQASSSTAWPYQLGGTTLTLGGLPVQLQYANSTQINALVPSVAPGLYALVLTTAQGTHSINLMIEQVVPSLFTLSGGTAAALHAATGQVVTASNPAVPGEYVSLFGTGLGPTSLSNGLNIAQTTPSVSIGGDQAAVTFAGRAPGFVGLDQINVQIPSSIQPAAQVAVSATSGNRTSNTVLLAVQ